jgi:HEAT repeat protein
MNLSKDGNVEIQRSAVLALGLVKEARACDRLQLLLREASPSVRAAAARALAQQAKGTSSAALQRQRKAVPALQKALDDTDLAVVVEAAESLGTLGIPEAGAVLTVLLRHTSPSARQTAALALERVAEPSCLDSLMAALNDPAAGIRFSLIGAIGHAAGDGHLLGDAQRNKILACVERIMTRDADPGVRSRAATVLGECGTASSLPVLWKVILAPEDARVQEKAWGAVIEIAGRSGNFELVKEWDRIILQSGQGQRRLQFLAQIAARWQKREELKRGATELQELLVSAQLESGKWSAALPVIRELLTGPPDDAAFDRYLRWLLRAGHLALKDAKRVDVQHIVAEAQPFLAGRPNLAAQFEALEKASK